MPRYVLDILVRGTDRASGPLGRIHGALGRILQVASGILIAGTIRTLTDKIGDLGRAAIDSYTDLERMRVGIQSLVARELSAGKVVETLTTSVAHLTDEEILQLDKLTLTMAELNTEISELQDEHGKAIDEFGEGSLEALKYSVAIRETQAALGEASKEYDKLAAKEGALVTSSSFAREGTMSLADALKMAREPAERLTKWIVRLSLTSPFEEDDITQVLRLAAGYGFATQTFGTTIGEVTRLKLAQAEGVVTAQRFTAAMLDFVAALGLESEDLVRVVRGIAQIQAKGKLAGEEIRQLTNAGVGFDLMARAMGMTVNEFTALQKEGKILADDFVPALIELIEKDLTGSALRMSQTLGGILTNLEKVTRLILREFFGPLFAYITPALHELFLELSDPDFLVQVNQKGQEFLAWLIEAHRRARGIYNVLKDISDLHLDDIAIEALVDPFEEDHPDIAEALTNIALGYNDMYDAVSNLNPELGFAAGNAEAASGAFSGLGLALSAGGIIGWFKRLGPLVTGVGLAILKRIGWIGLAFGLLGAAWQGDFLGIRTKLTEWWEGAGGIKGIFESVKTWLEEDLPGALETFKLEAAARFREVAQTVAPLVQEHVIMPLKILYKWLQFKVGEAIETARGKLETLRTRVEDEVIPAIITFYEHIRDDVVPALESWAETKWEEIAAGLDVVFGPIVDLMMGPGRFFFRFVTGVADSFTKLWEVFQNAEGQMFMQNFSHAMEILSAVVAPVTENLKPFAKTLGRAVGLLIQLREDVAERVRQAYDDFIGPVFEEFKTLFDEHIVPLVQAFLDLWLAIEDVVVRLVGGFFVNILLPQLEEIQDILANFLNPALEGFVLFWGMLEEIFDRRLEELLGWLAETVLPTIKSVLDGLAPIIDGVAAAFRGLAAAVRELADTHLPWWALPGSPVPAAVGLNAIADALQNVDSANRNRPLSRLGGGGGGQGQLGSGVGPTVHINVNGPVGRGQIDEIERVVRKIMNERGSYAYGVTRRG